MSVMYVEAPEWRIVILSRKPQNSIPIKLLDRIDSNEPILKLPTLRIMRIGSFELILSSSLIGIEFFDFFF